MNTDKPNAPKTATAARSGPKMSLQRLAETYGVEVSTVKRYKRQGVDVYNPEAFKSFQSVQTDLAANDKTPQDAFGLKLRKLAAETRDKEAGAELTEILLAKTKGELVEIGLVMETNLQIAGKIKAQLKRLIVELPPKLDGLTATKMSPVIREHVEDILQYLYDELKANDEDGETT